MLSSFHARPMNSEQTSSHPRTSDHNEQQQQQQQQPRKRTRCLRSCVSCRKAKQRCQLPNESIDPSDTPLPNHLACRRCVLLENECFVIDAAPRSSTSSIRQRGTSQPQTPQQSAFSITSPPFHTQREASNTISQAAVNHDKMFNGRELSDDRSTLCDSSTPTTPPPVNDLRIFDPEVAETLKSKGGQSVSRSTSLQIKTKDWIKVGKIVCSPFELLGYLLRKQSISRHLFAEGPRPISALVNMLSSVPDLRLRFEQEADVLQIGMPFLPSFDETLQAGSSAELFLGVMLYLSHSNRQELEHTTRLAPILRQYCLWCVLHQPRSTYDNIALFLIALHLPLLLGSLSEGNSLDGYGLFTSAASAAQSLGLDLAFHRLKSSSIHDLSSTDVRNACLWAALSLATGFAALAGDVERRPIIRCTSEDLDSLEIYIQAAFNSANTSLNTQRRCASISLLIYRLQATNEIRQLCHNSTLQMKIHRDDLDRSANITLLQATCDDSKMILQNCCDTLKRLQHPLASRLSAAYGWHRNYCIDVLGIDLAILQLLCFSRFCEKLFERSPRLIGHDSSPSDLLLLLHADRPLSKLYSTIGCHRADIAKHVLSLLMNIVRHGSIPMRSSNADAKSPILLLHTIPPAHLCSTLVMAAQAITEELDGRITDGQSPSKKIGDSSMEVVEILLNGTKESLMQMGESRHLSTYDAKRAAFQGNLFVLSARLIDSLLRRVIIWKGRDVNTEAFDESSNMNSEQNSYFDLDGFSPESFEDLFREILATPFHFM